MKLIYINDELFVQNIKWFVAAAVDYCEKAEIDTPPGAVITHIFGAMNEGLALAIVDEEGLSGFLILHLEELGGDRTLSVYAAYNRRGGDGFDAGWKKIQEIAKQLEVKSITCETAVGDRWNAYYKKRLSKLGFKPYKTKYRRPME